MDKYQNNANQDKAFHKALKKGGYIFPETDEELLNFEISISKMKFHIPEELNNPLKILKRGKIDKVHEFNTFYDEQVEGNLAQAARDGSNITDEVWLQMEKDRKKAEETKDDNNNN